MSKKSAGASQRPRAPRLRATSSLVMLSSAAVFSIYAVGFAETRQPRDYLQEQLALLDAAAATVTRLTPTAPGTNTPLPFRPSGAFTPLAAAPTSTPDPDLAPVPAATLVPGAAPAAAPAVAYIDGTYVGKGSGGHGWVEVTLIIEAGVITSAEISNCGTIYPCSKIRALPGRVIERQSAAVEWISGASDSSRGFRLAVLAALNKAKAS